MLGKIIEMVRLQKNVFSKLCDLLTKAGNIISVSPSYAPVSSSHWHFGGNDFVPLLNTSKHLNWIHQKLISILYLENFYMTRSQYKRKYLSGCVLKILTLCRIHKIIFKKYHVKALDQSFPMMYIKGGSTFGRSQSKRGFSPKNCLKNSFLGRHESGSSDFGGGWDLQF